MESQTILVSPDFSLVFPWYMFHKIVLTNCFGTYFQAFFVLTHERTYLLGWGYGRRESVALATRHSSIR
jgi:hypothetical protein